MLALIPEAAAIPATISRMRRSARSRVAGSSVRVVPASSAVCGRMLLAEPAVKSATETTQESSGSTLRETIVCSAVTICSAGDDGVHALIGECGVAAFALEANGEEIRGGHQRPLANREDADRQPRHVVHAVDFLDGEVFHQAVVDHRLGARAAFLGGLEDDDRRAREVAGAREIARGAEQHRGMAVMAAGVHLAGNAGAIGQVGRFLDRQRVHVGAKADGALALALAPLDDADDAGLADRGPDLVAAELAQTFGDEIGSARQVVEKLGIGVQIAPPSLRVGDQLLNRGIVSASTRLHCG